MRRFLGKKIWSFFLVDVDYAETPSLWSIAGGPLSFVIVDSPGGTAAPALVAAYAASTLTAGLATLMIALAMATGIASVFSHLARSDAKF